MTGREETGEKSKSIAMQTKTDKVVMYVILYCI